MNAVVVSRRQRVEHRAGAPCAAARHAAPLRVAVLLDWPRARVADGLREYWQRVAEAAQALESIDLSVHAPGDRRDTGVSAGPEHAGAHRPAPGAHSGSMLDRVRAGRALGWLHPRVLLQLSGCDVLHTAGSCAAAARTAAFARTLWRVALVASLHGPLDATTQRKAARWMATGRPRAATTGNERDAHRRKENFRYGSGHAHARRCDWVLSEHDDTGLAELIGHGRCSSLRRGLDRAQFHPRMRDRVRLRRQLGIPVTAPVICCAGPLEPGARADLLARAVRELADAGNPAHVIFIGSGQIYEELAREVREWGHFPGNVAQDTLAWLLASSDLYAQPSHSGAPANAVLEAMGCGIPVLVAPGGAQHHIRHGVDGLLMHADSSGEWAHAITRLLADIDTRLVMGRAARAAIERHVPTWREVLEQDLLPAWYAAAQRALVSNVMV